MGFDDLNLKAGDYVSHTDLGIGKIIKIGRNNVYIQFSKAKDYFINKNKAESKIKKHYFFQVGDYVEALDDEGKHKKGDRFVIAEIYSTYYRRTKGVVCGLSEDQVKLIKRKGESTTMKNLIKLVIGAAIAKWWVLDNELAQKFTKKIKEQIMRTVAHEIGHHFSIPEDRLRDLGY